MVRPETFCLETTYSSQTTRLQFFGEKTYPVESGYKPRSAAAAAE
jgi:hypothetical protein